MRQFFFWLMVLAFLGMGLCDLHHRDWRTGAGSILLAIVQVLVFWKGM